MVGKCEFELSTDGLDAMHRQQAGAGESCRHGPKQPCRLLLPVERFLKGLRQIWQHVMHSSSSTRTSGISCTVIRTQGVDEERAIHLFLMQKWLYLTCDTLDRAGLGPAVKLLFQLYLLQLHLVQFSCCIVKPRLYSF